MARPTKRVCGAIATTITTRSGRVAGRVALEEESDEDAADDDDSASSSSSASSDDTRWRPRRRRRAAAASSAPAPAAPPPPPSSSSGEPRRRAAAEVAKWAAAKLRGWEGEHKLRRGVDVDAAAARLGDKVAAAEGDRWRRGQPFLTSARKAKLERYLRETARRPAPK